MVTDVGQRKELIGRKEGPESGRKMRLKKAKDTSSRVELKPRSLSQTGAFPSSEGQGEAM